MASPTGSPSDSTPPSTEGTEGTEGPRPGPAPVGPGGHRALVTAPMGGPGLEELSKLAEVIYEPWIEQQPLKVYDGPELAQRLAAEKADILVVEADFVRGPVFDLPLTAIAATRGDPNNIDMAAATAAGVPVLRTPGRNADAVAELALALLLAVARRVLPGDRDVRELQVFRDGTIPYQRFRGWEIAGRRAALIGYGAVGRALGWRLRGLGMEVVAFDPYVQEAEHDLKAAVAGADVVSLHAAVTPETIGFFGAEQFSWARPGAVFLNTARAKLHDMDALVEALESGQVGGAGLDHFEGETLPEGHPLLSMDNVVLTPHIGGATAETEARGAQMVAADLSLLLAGRQPVHIVNPEVLEQQTKQVKT